MRNIIGILMMVLLVVSCDKGPEDSIPEGFTPEVMLKITPVKNQGRSSLCWVYAMLATIETEHLMQGDSVNLSTDYLARCFMEEQAMQLFREGENAPRMSMRGVGPMTIMLLRKYGAMPFDSYNAPKELNYNVLQRKVEKAVEVCRAKHMSEEKCLKEVQSLLDKEIGYLPRLVFMLGAQYTPLEFAHSVCGKKEYITLASVAKKGEGEEIDLPYDDNRYGCKAINISPDSLMNRMQWSLRKGHPVMWEGGPNDNHAVAVIGMGSDSKGKRYFVAKNSWGIDNPTKGMLYIPIEYVQKHTAMIVTKNN